MALRLLHVVRQGHLGELRRQRPCAGVMAHDANVDEVLREQHGVARVAARCCLDALSQQRHTCHGTEQRLQQALGLRWRPRRELYVLRGVCQHAQ